VVIKRFESLLQWDASGDDSSGEDVYDSQAMRAFLEINRSRNPEKHQAKEGDEWYFGMKTHLGVDRDSGMLHTAISTAANVSERSRKRRAFATGTQRKRISWTPDV